MKKMDNPRRYPYILTGLVFCGECGDRLCGKSAHGAKGKVGYYEHGWRYRRNYCKTESMHNCEAPTRFSAEKVHDFVLEKITTLLTDEKRGIALLKRGSEIDKKDPVKADIKRFQSRKSNIDRKLEALTERIAELPKEVSAKPLYAKMGQLQEQREELDGLLEEKRRELKGLMDTPASVENWQKFMEAFGRVFKSSLSVDDQTRLIKTLIHKIELGREEIKIHYYVGEEYINKKASNAAGLLLLCPNVSSSSLTFGGR